MRGREKVSPYSSSNGTGRRSTHTIEPCPSNPVTSWRRSGGRPASRTWGRRDRGDASAGDGGPGPPQRPSGGGNDAGGTAGGRPRRPPRRGSRGRRPAPPEAGKQHGAA